MTPETHHYPPGPATMKPCAVDGEMCQPFPDQDSPLCSWHWWQAQVLREALTTALPLRFDAEG